MVSFISHFAIPSTWTILLAGFTLLLLRLVHKTILYPAFLTPFRDIPTPSRRSLLGGNYVGLGSASRIPRLREWSATIPNKGLIRYYQNGNNERFLATSPEALNDILVVNASHFVKPAAVKANLTLITGNGLLLAEGETHRMQRKALMPAFSFRHVKNLYPVFWSKARELTQLVEGEIENQNKDKPPIIEVRGWATRATLDIIGLAGLGCNFGSLENPNNPLSRDYKQLRAEPSRLEALALMGLSLLVRYSSRIVSLLPTKRMKQIKTASTRIRARCSEIIDAKKGQDASKETDNDLIHVALHSGVFSDQGLVDQMMTFLAAGHGTTSHALQWAVFALCKHPDVQRRLRREIRDHLPSIQTPECAVTAEDIDNLPYLHAVCSETLRLYPPVPQTVREALHETTVAGYRIPKGTTFTIAPGVINVDEGLWGPDAREFNPERWMKEGCANSGGVRNHHGFLTFLQGSRSCIGATFARAELACLVAALVGRFHIELENLETAEVPTQQGVGAGPADGVRARFEVVEGW